MKTMPDIPKGLRVAFYARVSSDAQKDNETIASQVAALEERIRQDGQMLAAELRFVDEAWSGSTLVRPALERLRDTAAAGGLDRLYVYQPDRLARHYPHQVLLLQEFQQNGVEVRFLNQPAHPTPEERMLLEFQGIFAEYERAQILERSRRGKRYAAQAGKVSVLSRAPYGYRYVRKAEGLGVARYEVVADQAAVVQQIFTWVGQERLTIEQVCRRLNQQGVRTPRGNPHWTRTSVWNLLKNPAYQGTAVYGRRRVGERRPRLRTGRGWPAHPKRAGTLSATAPDDWVRIPVPALVSAELFAAVQEQLAENRQRQRAARTGARYLLQGLLVCQTCGYAWCGHAPAQRGYYRCLGGEGRRYAAGRVCPERGLRIADLDRVVWEDVRRVLLNPHLVEEEFQRRLQEPAAAAARGLPQAIAQAQRTIQRLIDAYAEGLLDKSEWEPRLQRAREQLTRLEAEARQQADREAEQRELKLLVGRWQDFADQVQSGLDTLGWEQQREVIRTVVKRIEVGAAAIRLVYRVNLPPFAKAPKGGLGQDCSIRQRARLAIYGQRRPFGGRGPQGAICFGLVPC
jgi:site-specific DNA recombinase